MTLEIVWRNPQPQARTTETVLRIRGDQSCSVYAVTKRDGTQEFSLISGKAA